MNPLPDQSESVRYRTIVADPPWAIGSFPTWEARGEGGVQTVTAGVPYRTMTTDEIAALPVRDLAAPDAHLYIWTINAYVEQTYAICRAWGFKPSKLLVWAKAPMGLGLGGAFGATTEYVLLGRRGSLKHNGRLDRNWWQWPRGQHSAKPEAFLDIVEQVSPGPYVELFARRDRLGWDTWGDESLQTARLAFDDQEAKS